MSDRGAYCCMCCIFLGIMVVIGGFVCLFIPPAQPSIHVTDASLTPPNTTHHHYHLALNITIRNPSFMYKAYNKKIKMVAFCNNKNLNMPIDTAELLPFGQKTRHKDSFIVLLFKGEEQEDDFQACRASNDGLYDDIIIEIYISDIHCMSGPNAMETYQSESEFICNLKVPLVTTSSDLNGFKDTKCKSSFGLYYYNHVGV